MTRRGRTMDDLTGRVFGNLTVTATFRRRQKPKKDVQWLCRCTCGATTWKRADNLRAGLVKSCGFAHRFHAASPSPIEVVAV